MSLQGESQENKTLQSPLFTSKAAAKQPHRAVVVDVPMSSASSSEDDTQFIDTVEGEIAFFRSMMRARPVGIHAQFHVLTIRNTILKDTGRTVATGEIWAKLRGMYDMDALEGLVSGLYTRARAWMALTEYTGTGGLRVSALAGLHAADHTLALALRGPHESPALSERVHASPRRWRL